MKRRLLATLLFATACDCGGRDLRESEPLASLVAARPCETPPPGAHPICLDFGLVPAGTNATAAVLVQAGSAAAIAISDASVGGPDAAVFTRALDVPAMVAGAGTMEIPIVFAPVFRPGDAAHLWQGATEAYVAELVVATDDPKHPQLSATIVGRGGIPLLRAEPDHLEFGTASVGSHTAPLRLKLSNEGSVDARAEKPPTFDSAAIQAGFHAVSSANVTHLAPGETAAFDLELAPTAPGPASGELVFDAGDPHGPLKVALSGTGIANHAPKSCLGIARVFDRFRQEKAREANGSYLLEPFDHVVVTAHPASDVAADATCPEDSGDPEGDPVFLEWGDLQAPAGSQAELSATSGLTSLAAWQRELVVDARGEYAVTLNVRENNGIGLSTEATARWHVAPLGIAISLDWTVEDADLDLHLVRPAWAGESFSAPRVCTGASGPDCYWGNCKLSVAGVPPLDWGASGPDDANGSIFRNDPTLNRDSTGVAPLTENVSVSLPEAGDYEIYVHFFEDGRAGRPGNVSCELSVALGDAAPSLLQEQLPVQGSLWHAGTIHWTGTASGSVVDTSTTGTAALSSCH